MGMSFIFVQIGSVFITHRVQTGIEIEHACMKISYFALNNDCFVIRFEIRCQFPQILHTHDMFGTMSMDPTPHDRLHWIWRKFCITMYQFSFPFFFFSVDCNMWKGKFETKCYEEPLASFIEVGHFGCLDVSTIMRVELENMDWRAIFELWHNMRNWRIFQYGLNG